MDALISAFVDDIKQRAALFTDDNDGNMFNDNSSTETDGKYFLWFYKFKGSRLQSVVIHDQTSYRSIEYDDQSLLLSNEVRRSIIDCNSVLSSNSAVW